MYKVSKDQGEQKPTEAPVSTTNNPAGYTNHSGGAIGSDTQWDVIGKEFGMVNNKHYFTGEKGPKNAPLGNVDITNNPIAVEGASKVAQAAKEMWGYKYNTMKDQRLIRNWAQVANSDAVFAIGTLGKEGDIWKGDEKSAEPRKLLKFAVQGGTGYAVEMAIQAGKPVYVFDQVRNQWYKNINGEWSKSEVPTLTKNFAGIGTREINDAGKQAIRDVYANTFKATTQPTVEPVGEVKEGVSEVFKSNPELAAIGTQEQYSQYLNSIFPDSQVKDIVYHGTNKDFPEFVSGKGFWGNAFYVTTEKGYANSIAASRARQEPGTSKIIKPLLINANNIEFEEDAYAINEFPENIDTILTNIEGGAKIIYAISKPEQIHILGGKQDIEGFKKFVSTKPTETKVEQPELNDSIENDMKVYQDLLKENNGKQPQSFMSDNRMYKLNKFGNYDVVDKTTGEIYVRNLNMDIGKQETEPGLDAPVSQEVIQRELNRIITLRAETNIEEQLAGLGYDINDIINNLANAKTQEDLNKITKILDKLC